MADGAAGSGFDAKLAAAHRVFLEDPRLQRDFDAAPPPQAPPPWLVKLLEALSAAAPVVKVVFWGGVAIGVALLIWIIIRDLPFVSLLRRRKPRPAAPDWRPEADAARALLGDADLLAAEGRFAEAIHLILFRSIDDIATRRPGSAPAAATTREIVEAAPLSERGRDAFRTIADAVERSFFAGRPAGRGDFDRCRSQYEAFALAEGAR